VLQTYLSPDPVAYFLDNAYKLLIWIPICDRYLPIPSGCTIPAVEFLAEITERRIRSNYNRNGLAEYHAEDLQDLFRAEFAGGKFQNQRQLNMITHSAGGIGTRALLALLNRSEFRTEQERVVNVVFTAPPFGGSTIAEVANIIYPDNLDSTIFFNPWLDSIVSNQLAAPMDVILTSFMQMSPDLGLTDAQIDEFIEIFSGASLRLGYDLLVAGIFLKTSIVQSESALNAIEAIRPILSDLFGIPGTPKVDIDLRPSGAITNLRAYEQNPFTKQFVTWGEGGFAYNLSPEIEVAPDANYGTLASVSLPRLSQSVSRRQCPH